MTTKRKASSSSSSSSKTRPRKRRGTRGSISSNETDPTQQEATSTLQVLVLKSLPAGGRERAKFLRYATKMGRDPDRRKLQTFVDPSSSYMHVLALADQRGNVKGFAEVEEVEDEGEGDSLHIHSIEVLKRGAGRGQLLLSSVEAMAQSTGSSKVTLTSVAGAKRFYEREGFLPAAPPFRSTSGGIMHPMEKRV